MMDGKRDRKGNRLYTNRDHERRWARNPDRMARETAAAAKKAREKKAAESDSCAVTALVGLGTVAGLATAAAQLFS